MPLPFAIKLDKGEPEQSSGQYIGHGQSKVAFATTDKSEVLNVSHRGDKVPLI